MAQEIPMTQAKSRFCDLAGRAEHGERFVITNHGRPVAEITPLSERGQGETLTVSVLTNARPPEVEIREAITRMRAQRKGRTLGGRTWEDVKNEGRRS